MLDFSSDLIPCRISRIEPQDFSIVAVLMKACKPHGLQAFLVQRPALGKCSTFLKSNYLPVAQYKEDLGCTSFPFYHDISVLVLIFDRTYFDECSTDSC